LTSRAGSGRGGDSVGQSSTWAAAEPVSHARIPSAAAIDRRWRHPVERRDGGERIGVAVGDRPAVERDFVVAGERWVDHAALADGVPDTPRLAPILSP
jgi:hypothetical protein